jgi:DNA-binding IclR family transcriptional regulator
VLYTLTAKSPEDLRDQLAAELERMADGTRSQANICNLKRDKRHCIERAQALSQAAAHFREIKVIWE